MKEQRAPVDDPIFQFGMKLVTYLKNYHRYEAHGLDHIPEKGAAMIAVSHSLATYDILLLAAEIYLRTGRYCIGLADRRIFQTPGIAHFFSRLKAVIGTPEAGKNLLSKGNLIIISPGGMRESLRTSENKYEINWTGRMGFARLAMKAQVPVILAACPSADDIFTLYENPITPKIYQNCKWPLPLFRGWGPSFLPRPVKLTHFISQPFSSPKLEKGEVNEAELEGFHRHLVGEMQRMLKK